MKPARALLFVLPFLLITISACVNDSGTTLPGPDPKGTSTCGDGVCDASETTASCPEDCTAPAVCGDGVCDASESADSCPADCGDKTPFCGNGACEAGETAANCPDDCDTVDPAVCGNGICDAGETTASCPQDCHAAAPVCGNGQCESGETATNCPHDCVSHQLFPRVPVERFPGRVGVIDTTPQQWRQVSAGYRHTCAIASDDTLWCWGMKTAGQLGLGDPAAVTSDTNVPRQVGTDTWTSVSAGYSHTCGIKKGDGKLYCWGANNVGQLGIGSTNASPQPIFSGANLLSFSGWKSVSAGGFHTCAIDNDGDLWCWGWNVFGQVGSGDGEVGDAITAPEKIGTLKWQSVSAGLHHTCGITASGVSVKCWGHNDSGQLGDDSVEQRDTPTDVALSGSINGWNTISAGVDHTCATRYQTTWCWGANDRGQLGNRSVSGKSLVPVQESWGFATWSSVDAGGSDACGITSSRTLYCWGANDVGQLTSVDTDGTIPFNVGSDFLSISAGDLHTCGIKADRTLWCWGGNSGGQLGDGTFSNQPLPVQVP